GKFSISLEPVETGEVIGSALDLVRPQAAARGIGLSKAVGWHGHVMADRQRLQQVLLNLLSNAVKYNRPEGAVTVSCDAAPSGRCRLTVTDTGPGIAPERMHRLFTPFDPLDVPEGSIEGTGVGLALSKGPGCVRPLGRMRSFWTCTCRTSAARRCSRGSRRIRRRVRSRSSS